MPGSAGIKVLRNGASGASRPRPPLDRGLLPGDEPDAGPAAAASGGDTEAHRPTGADAARGLRAVQEREIDRVGGTAPVEVDLRVIATSNRDLEAEVEAGRFREDLLFRLNVVNLHLPALRERPGDIAPLARHFVAKYTSVNDVPERPLSEEALARLRSHGWKGNVRELENRIHRAVLLASGDVIGPETIVVQARSTADTRTAASASGRLVGRTVADVERDLILETLQHTLGNRTHAATILGISIRTLRNKLKQYGEEGVAIPPRTALASGLADLRAVAREPTPGLWRLLLLPFGGPGEVGDLRLYLRDDPARRGSGQAQAGSDEDAPPRRAIFAFDFSRLGRCQLEVFCQGRRFDLVLRTQNPLGPSCAVGSRRCS